MDDNKRMMDSKYINNNTSKKIEEKEKFKNNENLVENLNTHSNVHSPNTHLHRDPLPNNSGLSKLDNSNKNDNNIKDNASSPLTSKNKLNPQDVELRKNAIKHNDPRNKSASDRVRRAGMRLAGVPNSMINALENAKAKKETQKKQGLFSNLLGSIFGGKSKEQVEEKANDGGGTFKISARMARVVFASTIVPILMFFLLLFVSLFVIYAALDKAGLPADKVLDAATEDIEKKLDGSSDSDTEDSGNKAINGSGDSVLKSNSTLIDISNSVYSIKLKNTNILAKTDEVDTGSDFDFDISMISELYPPLSEYENVDYSAAFFYKLSKLNNYYKEKCGKQILDIPLLIITLEQESDDMATVFASNLGYMSKEELTKSKIDTAFSKFYEYEYDWSNYQYSRNNSIHDMEILAQHMVEKRGEGYCVYSKDKYDEFLKEFIEKKYYLGNDDETYGTNGRSSSNYFQTYNLTEDQLVQIASLCGQEQGHSNPKGAAAEASLMANKFEISGGEYSKKYPNNGDALYHYVRGTGKPPKDWWWAKAPTFMDKRDAKPEIVEAVRDVLVNGNRTLPRYVVSHDCPNCGSDICSNSGKVGDICEVVTNGVKYTSYNEVANRSNYIPHETRVQNVYGSSYKIFYAFPSTAGDPFSYKSEDLRAQFGECHYDPDKKEFVDCVDFTDAFVDWLVNIANDNSHGYSQYDRDRLVDFDCSSLVYYGLKNNGFNTTQLGATPFTTRTEQAILKKQGFKEIAINSDLSQLKKGDILWRNGHTEVYIGEGMTVGAHSASNGGKSDGNPGDQNGNEISVVSIVQGNYWQYAYRYER